MQNQEKSEKICHNIRNLLNQESVFIGGILDNDFNETETREFILKFQRAGAGADLEKLFITMDRKLLIKNLVI